MSINEKTANKLQDVLAKNYDAERGYADAAEMTDHAQLIKWFAKQGKQRTKFAAEIAGEIKTLGEGVEPDGTFKGDMHRSWMNLKAAVGSTDESLFEECIRGEKASLEEYEEVLEDRDKLAPSIVSTLERHHAEIKSTLQEIKRLEDVADAKNL
jgi:uncharacterized protein (TIGR02284 family)